MEQLEDLPLADELYDYRGTEVPLWLPHNQGDVFADVDLTSLTGRSETGHVMLFLHPCTMRGKGGGLVERATVLHVKPKSSRKPLDEAGRWNRAYSVIPLPDFSGTQSDAFEADLMAMGAVPSELLERAKRVASFSQDGRSHMLHRIIYHLTRKAIPTGVIARSTARVQSEIELQSEWTMSAWKRLGELSEKQVFAVESEFQKILNAAWPEGQNDEDLLRSGLYSEDDGVHEDAVRYLRQLCETNQPGTCLSAEDD
ncbi:hypothetical protein [Arthrobacter bambusae]|uniref:hypothetical protein n=1 Tax=Arthrobacter bambusae TaxID=1338426 RepID=UPI0027855608|nr:hypothetical protein [Arthrobacter bambusae]MDQ0030906.1 hypothetical protein [Arthrobacter bambusae]MDQ0099271.1 hypothetical protein [Arthrobacter bambusae]